MDQNNLEINIDDATVINVATQSINDDPNRVDKRVTITDATGTYRTSPMLMGRNRSGIVLNDGTFVTEEKLKEAIRNTISNVKEGEVVVKRTGLKVKERDLDTLIDLVKEAAGTIVVGGYSPKLYNQDSAEWGVKNSNGGFVNKGVAFLGNKGIYLESGEYVNLEELQNAIRDYWAIRVPVPELAKDDSEYAFVRERRNYSYAIIPLVVAINLAAGLETTTIENQITHVESELGYQTVAFTEGEVQEESKTIVNPDYKLGDEFPVARGDSAYYDAALREGTQKVMDETGFYQEDKYEGMYRITGFAICDKDGNVLLDYKEDFEEENVGYLLYDLEEKVFNEQGIAYEDMSIRFHLGSNNDHTRLGWIEVDSNDVIPYESIEEITKNATFVTLFKGVEENFDGEYITLSNGVRLKVVDENGELLPEGTTIELEDESEYELRNLELTEETIVDSIETHKKLTYSVNGPVLAGSALLLVATALYNMKKKREAKNKTPEIYKFRDEERRSSFINDFERCKKEYEKKSRFGKLLKRIFLGSNYQVLQTLDPAQANDLYSKIINYVGPNYQIGPNDRVEFEGGKVFIKYSDGRKLNITEEAMNYVKDIGKDNPIDAKGMVDDEIRRGY